MRKTTEEYEVGKWYKHQDFYGKFLSIGTEDFWYFVTSERVLKDKFYEGVWGFYAGYEWSLVTDLSEIIPFLPPNHPLRKRNLSKKQKDNIINILHSI